jgi:hypothetical protein
MKTGLLISAAAVALALALPAYAGSYALWDFSNPTGDLGPSHTYSSTPDGGSITAMAFGPGNPDLFGKSAGPDEQGVGLTNSRFADGEITDGSFVQLDLGGLHDVNRIDALIAGNSTAGPDIWQAFLCNVSGTICTNEVAAGFTDAQTAIDISGYQYLDFTGANCDTAFLAGQCSGNNTVLLSSLGAAIETPVPEAGTLAIFGALLIAGGFWYQGRNRAGGGAAA